MAPIARPPPSPIHRPPRPLDPPTPGDFRCAWTYRQRVEKAILSWNREVTSAHLVDALAYEAKIFMALPDHVVGIKPPEEQCLRNEIEALRARLDKLEARLRIFEESSGRKCNALSHDKTPSIGRKSSRDTYSSATDSGLAGSDTYVNSPLVDKESIPSDQEGSSDHGVSNPIVDVDSSPGLSSANLHTSSNNRARRHYEHDVLLRDYLEDFYIHQNAIDEDYMVHISTAEWPR
ncbi:hypothetical protein BKA93DRAFT_343199 [Sparassis latifolia]|uniref:Uncharacterized protein n=1 Tax=Sparassis crispa TaxID=139825 RepID=A0A401GX49_9APHY|nr:hypothetical protein SCP_1000040 [Sparassis crispa]GBE86762.1 hypothetical protein SCP_1000040 [Sparassis crispa]